MDANTSLFRKMLQEWKKVQKSLESTIRSKKRRDSRNFVENGEELLFDSKNDYFRLNRRQIVFACSDCFHIHRNVEEWS